MSEMGERVALAIAPRLDNLMDRLGIDRTHYHTEIEDAIAIIVATTFAAMREPTQEMAYAALRDYDLGSLGIERHIFTNTDPRLGPAIYRQMIDEALK